MSPVPDTESTIFVALLACFDMLLMRAAPRAGAMLAFLFLAMRCACILVALLTSFDVLLVSAASRAGAMLTFILFVMRRASVLVALFASLDMLFVTTTLICHFSIPRFQY
ncbi:hypothetical protein [Acetobacter oeni]|uniref:hypothetical protein n=1 Tax=Acetobacter oeni TaxID=304077 RepID=UPI001649C202|nr:hypothetical protein [Acetobacter oeni]GBR10684.1 hypothetical protein AA21952_3129 [Acetobacter oeni LMG 21952]